jgi:hypothetical protein
MKLQRESSLVKNDAGILRSISNVKDVEANAERESGRESGTDPKTGKPVSVV